jgi:hypothetical protein
MQPSEIDRLRADVIQHISATLPSPVLDHREAKAQALVVLAGGDPLIAAREALNTLATRNAQLLDSRSDAIREALADQVAILEATVTRLTLDAAKARNPDQRKTLTGMALRASGVLTGTLLALHRVSEDSRNGQALTATAFEITD